jgi:cardiolipin synthase
MAQPPVAQRRRLTFRRLSGLDRSGPPPPQTLPGQPLRPWTIPNAIGYVRIAALVAFLVVALSSGDGTDPLAAVLFAFVGWGDYADGIAARVTGQYSRLGTLLDPVIDRLLVIAGVVVTWRFDLLPRWALAILVAREVAMLALARVALRHRIQLAINWWGRLGVWPTMSAIFFALVSLTDAAAILLYVGVAMTLVATALYLRDGLRQLAEQKASSSS